uniref:Putative ixodes 10 kDa peptide protein n=1 Tax=Ixodes ricinus TaxID=34613 RepID=A0A0K8RBD8_IXORI
MCNIFLFVKSYCDTPSLFRGCFQIFVGLQRRTLSLSKMQLVVFAVVLILPTLQSGGFLFGSEILDDCPDILTRCGDIQCRLDGSGDFYDYDPQFCTLTCTKPSTPRKLPDGVCSPGYGLNCTRFGRESLLNWEFTLQSSLNHVLVKWCPDYLKK